MAKKKKHKTGTPAKPLVRLSQCMIVKNEEKNIEKALSWGKRIVFEQIVVDTGSADRTVEIAQSMGAKVLHFEWVNDFAAAKNYAIEQARGNWIAFLDADEYIDDDDLGRVMPLLEHIMSDPKMRRDYLAVACHMLQLNDKGMPKDILTQERFFQNLPKIRYTGRIHERLTLEKKDVVATQDFRIVHTGYTGESFMTTGKASRNIALLREELKGNPKDLNIKAYLAEALRAEAAVDEETAESPEMQGIVKAKRDEVDRLFKEVADSRGKVEPLLKESAYEHFLRKYSGIAGVDPELDKISVKAHREFPDNLMFTCYYAMAVNKRGNHREAFDILKGCEARIENETEENSMLTTKITELLASQMILSAQALGDLKTVIKYAEVLLFMNKNNENVLQPYIATLMRDQMSTEEALDMLAHVYDMSSKKDLLFIARAAKNCGAINLARRIIDVVGYLGNDN